MILVYVHLKMLRFQAIYVGAGKEIEKELNDELISTDY